MSAEALDSSIYILEIIIGFIYISKILVIGAAYYKKTSKTLILNQDELDQYQK